MGVLLEDENSNHIERELANNISCSVSHNDTDVFPNKRETSSQEYENREFFDENQIPKHEILMETMEIFSNEMNIEMNMKWDFHQI